MSILILDCPVLLILPLSPGPENGEDALKAVEKVVAVYVLRGVAGAEAAVSERQSLIYYLYYLYYGVRAEGRCRGGGCCV